MFNARMNQAIDQRCNWNDGDVLFLELVIVVYRGASSIIAIYCFGSQKTQFISELIEPTFIDITQLICPPFAAIILRVISCTFLIQNRSKHVCDFRTAYSLTQWLNS